MISERTIIVSEYVGAPLTECGGQLMLDVIKKCFYQIASALAHINEQGFVCHSLEPATVLLDELNNVKLFNYGLFYMTNGGDYVTFPIGYIFNAKF